jgi:hypothetical protein
MSITKEEEEEEEEEQEEEETLTPHSLANNSLALVIEA